jgi:hypothetical protein
MELIKEKREDLEKRRSSDSVSTSLLTVLENEIKELESSLSSSDSSSKSDGQQMFLDECAG